MFPFQKKVNNPLHLAVIDGDLNAVRGLMEQSDLCLEQNNLGFTAIELAHFLQREEIVKLLKPEHTCKINILLPDKTKIRSFTKKEFVKAFNIKYAEYPHFLSYKDLVSTIKNLPFSLRMNLFSSDNSLLGRLYQSELTNAHTAKLSIRWIDNTLGYGVYAEEDLNEGTFVGEYTGIVRKLCRMDPDPNAYCFHYPTKFWSLNYTVVDALNEGNILRFVNHSGLPNLSPICMVDRGLVRIVFIANRKIESGEQLMFDYGKDYWKKRTKKQL